ncbi:SPFH domain-containing protein [Rothia amarae]|uniref:SPFH domain-containing protein n=1 Tax=Rothia amarae TaxID=169480 RepID=A0A7H2BK39_9MICC|nr:SPFH domain-containing protein [Rothia amarae]QNV40035.1 SPFH domain-containing protein [Rothia amarae]SIK58757.1 membrane protease subunit, stomatin/prohibitin [Mycobacteroides abscessus subsp. abscessus]
MTAALVSLVLLIILVALALIFLVSCILVVPQSDVYVIEKLGKYNRTLSSGLHFRLPFVERVAYKQTLRIRELDLLVATKTQDNVFVQVPVNVQYFVNENEQDVKNAVYKLSNPENQMRSYIQQNIVGSLSKLDLDEAYGSLHQVGLALQGELTEKIGEYGYVIKDTNVIDVEPAPEVKDAMNQVNASERKRQAQILTAEGNKQAAILDAEAERDARRLRGEGIAQEGDEIAKGMKERIDKLKDAGLSAEAAVEWLKFNDGMAVYSALASSNNAKVIMMDGSNLSGKNRSMTSDDITRSIIQAEEVQSHR